MLTRKSAVALLYSVILSIFIATLSFAAEAVPVKVVSVTDGDTIKVVANNSQIKIRLYGIDAPEKSQPFGQASAAALKSLITGRNITVENIDQDRYGRTVALVFADGASVNQAMVRAGYAWVYSQYCTLSFCSNWSQNQQSAQSAQLGLWKDAAPMPPWEWRHGGEQQSTNAQISAPVEQPTHNDVAGVFHGNLRSHKFHRSSCKDYNCKNCTVVFRSREEAIAAGYSPCGNCRP
ncbi:MAG: thermonuclease family protein [Desulfobulbus sp.]|nr:thermonuclease family protein [Desulfobulbus sp.]